MCRPERRRFCVKHMVTCFDLLLEISIKLDPVEAGLPLCHLFRDIVVYFDNILNASHVFTSCKHRKHCIFYYNSDTILFGLPHLTVKRYSSFNPTLLLLTEKKIVTLMTFWKCWSLSVLLALICLTLLY